MALVVQKYGGSSVGTIEKIKNVARRVAKRRENGDQVVVVVSAMGKTTNMLVEMSKEISDNPSKREMDMLMSTGEQISISLLSIALKELGFESVSMTGFQAGIHTGGRHTKARITDIEISNVKEELDNGNIVVVAGFQGVNEKGSITTLGRGGSDTTAVALAAKLSCGCEIYTDVEGIYTVDPRLYTEAKKLETISYEEMMEMASLGAGVMQTRSVEIGQRFGVPIYVALSTEERPGTYIKEHDASMEEKVITGLSVSDDDIMITINGIPYSSKVVSGLFEKLAGRDVNIDMISQTAPYDNCINISFTADKGDLKAIQEVIGTFKKEIGGVTTEIDEEITKLSVVGNGMRTHSGVAAKIFKILAENDIEFKQITTSEIRISYTINPKDKIKAVHAIAKVFNL
jgi:aspartate kinase